MRTVVEDFSFVKPDSLQHALTLKNEDPSRKFFAGGTDLMVEIEAGMLQTGTFIDLHQIEELHGIKESPDHITVGAMVSYADLMKHPVIQKEFPLLREAAKETAAPAIQNRGTIGGNVANASPAADTPPSMLTYDCRMCLSSTAGERWIDYQDFHIDYKKMDLKPDEMITKFEFKRGPQADLVRYQKIGTRKMQAISKVVFAAQGRMENEKFADVRLAFGSVAPRPIRCKEVEKAINGCALKELSLEALQNAARQEIVPIDDVRSTSEYRFEVSVNLIWRFLSDLQAKG